VGLGDGEEIQREGERTKGGKGKEGEGRGNSEFNQVR
jgi:hypothetical protein